jgi:replicative DNA helicase
MSRERFRNAELAVLGACLVDQSAYWKCADLIGPDDFALPAHCSLWNAIAEQRKAGRDADFITIAEQHPDLTAIATSASNGAFATTNVRLYAELVLSDAVQRRVNAAGLRIAKLVGEDSMGEAQKILGACQPQAGGAAKPIREYLRESVRMMQERCEATEVLTGVATSLPWLDEQTAGWQRGDLVILAARPSVGKTALALQFALHAAQVGHPIFFASLEQSGAQIADRSLAHLSGVSLQHILQPKRVEEWEWPKISAAGAILEKLPLYVDESAAVKVEAISARARQLNATKRLGLIVIDYLTQIMPPRADKVADAIQTITRAIKALAKELGVPVILLSQLNRDGAEKPKLTHLRDSGAIEQDADAVLFLHRPDDSNRELVELTIAKHRNGPCDSTYLAAHMDIMKFSETQDVPQTPTPPRRRGFNTFAARSSEVAL